MSVATVTTKGQVTIPADIRENYNISAGDKLVFYPSLEGDLRLHVEKAVPSAGAGMLSARGRHVDVPAMDKAIARAIRKRHRQAGRK
jgi:antitoxin PrlF